MMVTKLLSKSVLFTWFLIGAVKSQEGISMIPMSDVINSPTYYENKCEYKNICTHPINCQCDESCIPYDDCCKDADRTNFTTTLTPLSKYMSCLQVDWRQNTSNGKGFTVVSKCPTSFTDEGIKAKCHDIGMNDVLGNIPVISKRTYLSYRNVYCAQCHGVDEVEIWEITVHCNSFIDNNMQKFVLQDIMTSFLFTDTCGYRFDLPQKYNENESRQRRCNSKVKYTYLDECPEGSDPLVSTLCREFQRPLYTFHDEGLFRFYKNRHCLQCDTTLVEASLFKQLTVGCDGPRPQVHRFFPMAIVLNFSALLYDSSELISACGENEVYIEKLDQCVLLHCPENSFAKNSMCVPYGKRMNSFAITALFYINGSVDEMIVKEQLQKSASDIGFRCGEYITTANDQSNNITLMTGTDLRSNQSCMYALMQQEFRTQGYVYTTNHSQCVQTNLQQHAQQLPDDAVMTYVDNITSMSCDMNENVYVPPFISTPFLRLPDETINCPSVEVYKFHPEKSTNQSEGYDITMQFYRIGDIVIDSRNITVTPEGYFICWSVFKEYYDKLAEVERSKTFTIITHICLGLSISSLLVTFCHYCVVPKLLTNHSIILLHLVVITLSTHSLYMVSLYLPSDTDACWVVAIVLHGLFLALFTSSSLTLLQITRQLRSMKNPFVKKNVMAMLARYVLSGYVASLTVVGLTVLVKKFKFPNEVWYGKSACFISNPYVLLCSFALPVALTLLFNVCVFSFTMRSFCLDKSQNSSTAAVNRSYFMLSLKLSTLLGISWLVGYLAVIINNIVLLVLYEVTTALHGVMLSSGLLSNKAVINWYKAKCPCRLERIQSGNQDTNTTQ